MLDKSTRKLFLAALTPALLILILLQGAVVRSQGSPTQSPTVAATLMAYTGPFDGTLLFGIPVALTGSLSNLKRSCAALTTSYRVIPASVSKMNR
jgi:hypothetical protein